MSDLDRADSPASQYPVPVERVAATIAPEATLADRLAQFKIDRDAVLTFVKEYLVEAEYDDKGNPIAGKLGDYYKVHGSEQRALTKGGASKVKQLFRWHRGAARHVDGRQDKDYCSATIEVPILDRYGHTVGAGIGSCNTAEYRFRSVGNIKKYGGWAEKGKGGPPKVTKEPDYRAALHDIISIATKRADTQATIVAAALEEVFTGTTDDEGRDEKPEEREPAEHPGRPVEPRLPKGKFGKHGGKLLAEVPTADLGLILEWATKRAKSPKVWAPLARAVERELEVRRHDEEPVDPDDDLPF